jgi:hypothetical protein
MTFDNGYDTGDVVRLFFGHAPAVEHGGPFARIDLVVLSDGGDQITGHRASVSDKTRGAIDDDPEAAPTHRVRVYDDTRTVRKSAVVMKRHFGSVDADDVNVAQDDTGSWSNDDTDE